MTGAKTVPSHWRTTLDIILGGARPEASDALFTLVRSLKGAPAVRIFDYRRDGTITELADNRCFEPATARRTLGWQRLLSEVLRRKLPPLVRDVMDKVGREELRAYPMLSQPGRWSIRLEGLEVARLDGSGGFVDVGKNGKNSDVGTARQRVAPSCRTKRVKSCASRRPRRQRCHRAANHTIRRGMAPPERRAAERTRAGITHSPRPHTYRCAGCRRTRPDPPPRRGLGGTSTGEASSRRYGEPTAQLATWTPCSTRGGHRGQSR